MLRITAVVFSQICQPLKRISCSPIGTGYRNLTFVKICDLLIASALPTQAYGRAHISALIEAMLTIVTRLNTDWEKRKAAHRAIPACLPKIRISPAIWALMIRINNKHSAALSLALLGTVPAMAQDLAPLDHATPSAQCANNDETLSADLQIAACTSLLQSKTMGPAKLVKALKDRAGAYMRQRDYVRAIADYSEAIKINTQLPKTFNDRGRAYYRQGNFPLALADFKEAIGLNPKYYQAFSNRGLVHSALRDFTGALADYNQAIRLNPHFANAFRNRGNAHVALKNYPSALSDFNEAIRLDPQFAQAFYSRGSLYARMLDFPKAVADFDTATRLDPKDARAFQGRGRIHLTLQNWQAAWNDFNTAVQLNPNSGRALRNRGLAARQLGRVAEGDRDIVRAATLDLAEPTEKASASPGAKQTAGMLSTIPD